MTEIFSVVLAKNNERKLTFRHAGSALPGGRSRLQVTDEMGGSWNFECKSEGEGDGYFSLRGPQWSRFAKSKVDVRVTLCREADQSYTIRVKNSR